MGYERDNIARLDPYTPGEQPSYRDTDAGLLGDGPGGAAAAGGDDPAAAGIVKLNTNENPYPPSPRVLEAIRTLPAEALRLYPPADARLFRAVAADLHGLTPDHVIATNGGDELLRLLISVFCKPCVGDTPGGTSGGGRGASRGGRGGIGMTSPSYTLYAVLAAIHDTPVTVVNRTGDEFALPDDYAERLTAAGSRLAFVVNPHAPTGRFEPVERLAAIADSFDGVLVIDEAYVDFAPGDAVSLVQAGRGNVVILRSLSKGYALAGLRFGYGLAHPDLIAAMDKARDSYNTDILAQAAAAAALRDRGYFERSRDAVIAERARLTAALRDRGFTVPDSASNFLLATVPPLSSAEPGSAGGSAPLARHLYEALKADGILIRYFDKPRLADKLRITVGTPAQNDRLLAALDEAVSAARGPRTARLAVSAST